jgi:hypothetical protein
MLDSQTGQLEASEASCDFLWHFIPNLSRLPGGRNLRSRSVSNSVFLFPRIF